MESANLHHQHQLQDQLVGSSSLSTTASGYEAGSAHAWTQNINLNTASDFNPNCNGAIFNPSNKNERQIHPLSSSMIQDLSFHWNGNAAGGSFTNQSAHLLQLAKIKDELSSPKFTELLNSASSIEDHSHLSFTNYIKDEQKDLNDLSEKLLLKTISSGFPINGQQFSSRDIYSASTQNGSSFGSSIPSRGNFSQIYPSINISNLNQPSSSFDMNLQALDLINSTSFNGSFGQPSHSNLGLYKESHSFDPMQQQQQSSHTPSCSPSKISSFTTEITEAKRPNNSLVEPKATTQAASKKSRLESRASCSPFKVRKEKLGDRIAALQQLVAPFGKTDTASVLMEAIGYITFLQNQVETLSVPYMKSSRNNASRSTPQGSTAERGSNQETTRDLKSRGLCLVPLSCMSYMTNDGGGGGRGMWAPPNFGGGT